MTLSQLFATFLPEYLLERKASSHGTWRTHAKKLIEGLGDVPLETVTTAAIRSWMARASISLEPASVVHRLSFLRQAMAWAIENHYLVGVNPTTGIKSPKINNERQRYLYDTEERIIQIRATAEVFTVVRFAILTGLRRLEIFNIQSSHVLWPDRALYVADSKTGYPRTIPLHPEAYAILEYWDAVNRALQAISPSNFLFEPHLHPTERWRAAASWCEGNFVPLIVACGIVNLHFHDLRHTFASRMVKAGVPLYTVGVLLGHRNPKHTQRYAHLDAEHLRAAVYRLN